MPEVDDAGGQLLASGMPLRIYANDALKKHNRARYRLCAEVALLPLLGWVGLKAIPSASTVAMQSCGYMDWSCERAAEDKVAAARAATSTFIELTAVIAVLVVLVILAVPWLVRLRAAAAKVGLERVDDHRGLAHVRTMVEDLRRRMDLPIPVRMYLDRHATHALPSVFVRRVDECRWEADLVLPLGFLTLARKRRAHAEAILAHELAHVQNGDTDYHVQLEWYTRTLLFVIAPLLAAAAVFAVSEESAVQIKPWWMVVLVIDAVRSVRRLRELRWWSEELADMKALVYTPPGALRTAITTLLRRDGGLVRAHPDPAHRAEKLAEYELTLARWRAAGVRPMIA